MNDVTKFIKRIDQFNRQAETLAEKYPDFEKEATLNFMAKHGIKSVSEGFSKMTGKDIPVQDWNEPVEKIEITSENLSSEVRKSLTGLDFSDESPGGPSKMEEKEVPNLGPARHNDLERHLEKIGSQET